MLISKDFRLGMSPENLFVEIDHTDGVIIRKNFYHPAFHGSTSIKKTLPVLVPAITYEGM